MISNNRILTPIPFKADLNKTVNLCKHRHTLNVIMLNNETFPPAADITYESFFDRAMHGNASSRLTPETSLVIRRPLFGCQCCGTTLAVAFLSRHQLQKSLQRFTIKNERELNIKNEKH